MQTNFKKFFVVKYDCWDFANRLWNDMGIYAAGLELDAIVTFTPGIERIRFLRPLYELWAQFTGRMLHPKSSVFAWGGTVKYLPPTEVMNPKYDSQKSLYFLGMLFRNPEGFKKYGAQLREKFAPSPSTARTIASRLAPLQGRTLIGIQIRQKPFTYFPGGEFLLPITRTLEILEEYLKKRNLTKDTVGLVLVSDLPLSPAMFEEYHTAFFVGNPQLGFYALAKTAAIVGTNSSMSNLSAWFGDIAHIVTRTDPIDWEYYQDRDVFFENKYATFTQKVTLATSP